MNNLFESANEYVRRSDWKTLALVKFCLCAMGILIGIHVPKQKKKPVGIAALLVFLGTYVLLVPPFFRILLNKSDITTDCND